MSGFPLRFVEAGATAGAAGTTGTAGTTGAGVARVAGVPLAGGRGSAGAPEDVTVVTAGVWDCVRRWIAAWEASPNRGRWKVAIGWAEDFPATEVDRLGRAGYGLIDMRDANAECLRLFFHAYNAKAPPNKQRTPHKALWASKVRAMMACRTRWCVWLDHDAEPQGDIAPIVAHAQGLGKWMCSPKYASMGTGVYAGKLVAQHGLCVVDTWKPDLSRWWAAMVLYDQPHDERVLLPLFGGFEAADQSVGDLYRPEWYASCDTYMERFSDMDAANRLLLASRSAIRHWTGPRAKAFFRQLYP